MKRVAKKKLFAAIFFIFLVMKLQAENARVENARVENVRALVAGVQRVSLDEPEGVSIPLSYQSSSIIMIEGDTRFFRGIQLELIAPQHFLLHQGSLQAALYGELDRVPAAGVAELNCRLLGQDTVPARVRTIYQVPLRQDSGLRTTPYSTVLTPALDLPAFPLLFRLMPLGEAASEDLAGMVFVLLVRPIFSNEGALRINFRYPPNLAGRPLSVFINGEAIENPEETRLMPAGEHHLLVLSDDYRHINSRFVVERASALELLVELTDTTPLLIFEHPAGTRVYLNGVFLFDTTAPRPVEPGVHEVRFQLSDYTIIRPITVQNGKTYRVALSVGFTVWESE